MNKPERLQKYLASCAVASRRKCEELMSAGVVKVNGKKVTELGSKVIPGKDVVEVNGKKVYPPSEFIYLMLNKPRDYITTKNDPAGRKTVYELLPPELASKVFAIGRLDRNTTGLLLFTNNGELANTLTHPRHKIAKTYLALVQGRIRLTDLQKLSNGVQLDERITQPAKLEIIEEDRGQTTVQVQITEGMYRQVRRMFEVLGYEVIRLKRTALGELGLGSLAPGKTRSLNKFEIKYLEKIK
jgi:23S rRNA pseudouridine2605 synthase